MRRLIALTVLAMLALLVLPLALSRAMAQPGRFEGAHPTGNTAEGPLRCCRRWRGPPVIAEIEIRQPRRRYRTTLRRLRYRSPYLADNYARMYVIHNYPRGIVATFGCPRPCHGPYHD
jgi:hypothetical protein